MSDNTNTPSVQTASVQTASVQHDSIVDGPGLRFVLFVQGCPHRCPGCHNPDTHDPSGGEPHSTEQLLAELRRNPLQTGVTLSGGEPLAQAQALLPFAEAVVRDGYSLWIYTGYRWEDILTDTRQLALCRLAEVVVDGLFEETTRSLSLPWRGSHNQRLIDVAGSLAAGKTVCWEQA